MGRMLTALLLGIAAAGGTAIAQEGPPRGGPMGMMRADTNGDGAISRAEYRAEAAARFARRDTNGNGRIDEGEAMRGRGMRGPGPEGALSPPPPPPPPPPAGAAPGTGATRPPPVQPFGVGRTREQFDALALEQFDRVDTNRDGTIDQAEMRAAAPMRGYRPAPAQ